MRDEPKIHRLQFNDAWDASVNKFIREFTTDFCYDDGNVNWEKLTRKESLNKRKNQMIMTRQLTPFAKTR